MMLIYVCNSSTAVSRYVANYHRLNDPNTYKCDEAKKMCVMDKSGTYTDPSLCNANCGHTQCVGRCGSTPPAPQPLTSCPPADVTITIKHAVSTMVLAITRLFITLDCSIVLYALLGRNYHPTSSHHTLALAQSLCTIRLVPLFPTQFG